ncbi:hypothetical protein CK203_109809 [Vitis vinifera]|uniref:Uncharacterized protein n=1 Tax=Vitis vinifera TaxID=29760 RepID=A0A438FE19_VITVI|nr:hypothetical protein CK203_109809 [Vitis vinifera]
MARIRGGIQTLHCLASPGQEPPLREILHLRPPRPQPFQCPSGISPKAIIKWPMVTAPPIEGNSIVEPDHFIMSYILTSRKFFYPRVAMDFYQSMTTQGQSFTAIYFSIDGRQGILEARHVVEALHIPYEPVDPADFRSGPLYLSGHGPHLIRGTSGDSVLLRKELPPGMLLVDVLPQSNLFPL